MKLYNFYCPRCGRKLGTYNEKTSMRIWVKCRNCLKTIIFDPKTKDVLLADEPQRTTSSGKILI